MTRKRLWQESVQLQCRGKEQELKLKLAEAETSLSVAQVQLQMTHGGGGEDSRRRLPLRYMAGAEAHDPLRRPLACSPPDRRGGWLYLATISDLALDDCDSLCLNGEGWLLRRRGRRKILHKCACGGGGLLAGGGDERGAAGGPRQRPGRTSRRSGSAVHLSRSEILNLNLSQIPS